MDAVVLRDRITANMTDDEFLRFCEGNPDLRIERNSNFEIVILPPVSSMSGFLSGEVYGQLREWNLKRKKGIVFDSSAGFSLPDRSVLSPDASWISKEKWNGLGDDDKNRFAPVCPEFIIEVRSKSDHLSDLKKKMTVWLKNGAQLAWLIDPQDKMSYIYRPGLPEQVIAGFDKKLEGTGPAEGFVLDLTQLTP